MDDIQPQVQPHDELSFTAPPADDTISFTPTTSKPVLPPDVATARASKISYGTGLNPVDALAQLNQGREDQMRNEAASQADIQFQQQKQQFLQDYVQKRGGDVRPEELQTFMEMTKDDFKTDPQTIFEKKYAQKFVRDSVVESSTDAPVGLWGESFKENPTATTQNMIIAAKTLQRQQVINTMAEDLQAEADQRSNVDKLWDVGKSALPIYSNWGLSSVIKQVPGSIFQGDTMRAKVSYLLALPPEEMQPRLKAAVDYLKARNINDAQALVASLKEYSTNSQLFDNLVSATDIYALTPLKTIGRLAGRALDAQAVGIGRLSNKGIQQIPLDATKIPPINEVVQDAVKTRPILVNNRDVSRYILDQEDKALTNPNAVNHSVQLDLFHGDPRQGDLFAGSRPGEGKYDRTKTELDYLLKPDKVTEKPAEQLGLDLQGGKGTQKPTKLPPIKDLSSIGSYRARTPAEIAAKEDSLSRDVDGRWATSSTRYRQLELERDQDSVSAGFDKVQLKPGERPAPSDLTPRETPVTPDANAGKYKQGDLALNTPTHQRSLDLAPPQPKVINPAKQLPPKVVEQQIALDGVLKAAGQPQAEAARAAEQSGNIAQASVYGAEQRVLKLDQTQYRIWDDLPSSHNPTEYFGKATSLSTQRSLEMAQDAASRQKIFDGAFDLAVRNNRLSDEAVKVGIQEASERLHRNFDWRFNDGILDTVHIPAEFSRANVDQVVLRIGKMGSKDIFKSADEAHTYARMAYNLDKSEYKVYQQGSSYYLGVPTSIRETSDKVMAANFTPKNATPTGIINTILGKLRSAEDLLGIEHSGERKVAVHAQQSLRAVEKNIGEPLSRLSKAHKEELDQVLADGRDYVPTGTPSSSVDRGRWFETASEFERAFIARHKKMPTPEQTEANYIVRQMYDNEFVIRNAGVYRDMARQGAEQHALNIEGKTSPFFNGIEKDRLPWGSKDDASILVYDTTDKTPRTGWLKDATSNTGKLTRNELEDLIDRRGFKVIQTLSPSSKPMQGIFGDTIGHTPINYVVTNASQSKPLAWSQLTYRPGGHSIYPYEYYVKQPIIQTGHEGRSFYYGDNTLWNFSSKAQADEWTGKLNVAIQKFRDKAPDFDTYLANNLPLSRKEFLTLKDKFDFERDFHVTQAGKSVFETTPDLEAKYPGTVNFHKSAHNPENFMDRAFVQDRDNVINTIQGTGQITPAKQLDPLTALQKGLNQAIRSTWLNDYKIGAVNRWIDQFRNLHLDPEALNNNPLYHLYNPQWKKVGDAERPALVAAQLEQKAIINFIGQQSEVGEAISAVQTKLMDTLYNKFGDKPVNYLADHHLAFIKDPASYFRGFAYHTQVGLFNPVQAIQQAAILGNILAISPRHAIPGTAAGIFMNSLAHTGEEAIVNAAANKMTKFGMSSADFKEMYNAYKGTGLYHVGSEAALRHDNFDNKIFQNAWGNFLDKGSMFFNGGERLGRASSFATIYMEYKLANPGAKIGDREIRDILQRADLMTGNMTTASLNGYQKGILSIPLQFTTFFTRMAEQMIGSRLTTAEKARLFAVNSFFFGVPVATGVGGLPGAVAGAVSGVMNTDGDAFDKTKAAGIKALSGTIGAWPMYDDMKEYAMKHNIPISEGYWKALADGVPALAASLISGKDVDFHAYGPGGTSFIRDILRSDKPFMDVLEGASGKVTGDFMSSAYPLWRKTADIFANNGEETMGAFQASDFLRLARNVGAMDLGVRGYMAYRYGKFYTKNNIEVNSSPLDGFDAALVALRINPDSVDKTFTQMGIDKDTKNIQDKYEKLALEAYRQGLQFGQGGDVAKQEQYWKDASGYMKVGDFSPSERSRILKRAFDSSGPMEDSIQRQFLKKAPQEQYVDRFNQFFSQKAKQQ